MDVHGSEMKIRKFPSLIAIRIDWRLSELIGQPINFDCSIVASVCVPACPTHIYSLTGRQASFLGTGYQFWRLAQKLKKTAADQQLGERGQLNDKEKEAEGKERI
ncbi:MAG: hypothetical protein JNK38_16185 [Acidobacteria bacterium]|nr:hypothetical protein [Acidobacteriota bacterium]